MSERDRDLMERDDYIAVLKHRLAKAEKELASVEIQRDDAQGAVEEAVEFIEDKGESGIRKTAVLCFLRAVLAIPDEPDDGAI